MVRTFTFLFLFGSVLFSTAAQADECGSVNGNLVTNCGFETGTFAGWSLSGSQSSAAYLGVSHGVDAVDAHSGNDGAYFGGFGGVLNLSELMPTLPGAEYRITYWLAQSPATPAPYPSAFQTNFSATRSSAQAMLPILLTGSTAFCRSRPRWNRC